MTSSFTARSSRLGAQSLLHSKAPAAGRGLPCRLRSLPSCQRRRARDHGRWQRRVGGARGQAAQDGGLRARARARRSPGRSDRRAPAGPNRPSLLRGRPVRSRARLGAIVADEFGDEELDLVIDDASHRLEPTRTSFETLFPRLRDGGLYLIEDWKWQIRIAAAVAKGLRDPDSGAKAKLGRRLRRASRQSTARDDPERDAKRREPPLPALVFELVLAKAESDECVSEVTVGPWWVSVRRGSGELDLEKFRLADLYTDRLGLLPST